MANFSNSMKFNSETGFRLLSSRYTGIEGIFFVIFTQIAWNHLLNTNFIRSIRFWVARFWPSGVAPGGEWRVRHRMDNHDIYICIYEYLWFGGFLSFSLSFSWQLTAPTAELIFHTHAATYYDNYPYYYNYYYHTHTHTHHVYIHRHKIDDTPTPTSCPTHFVVV